MERIGAAELGGIMYIKVTCQDYVRTEKKKNPQ